MNFALKIALAASVSLASLATPAFAQSQSDTKQETAKEGPQLGTFGFDTAGMDSSVSPADDFYGFANGKWAANTPIPADKSNYGMFTALDDLSKDRVKIVLEAEKARISKEIARLEGELAKANAKLGNEAFVAKAPPAVIDEAKKRIADFTATLGRLRDQLTRLG